MREALATREEVVFVGDGLRSDSCAAGIATTVFARSKLLDYCRKNGIPASPFEDFVPVAEYIRAKPQTSQETTEIS
jgi:2-hydroxy-3-keto-5-methylthiopentenyl-1-phosphate phosphatase